jgi:hypothetical protein
LLCVLDFISFILLIFVFLLSIIFLKLFFYFLPGPILCQCEECPNAGPFPGDAVEPQPGPAAGGDRPHEDWQVGGRKRNEVK